MKTKVNGAVVPPSVLAPPGAERSVAERSEAACSAVPGGTKTLPDPEVPDKARRRQFAADYKRRILVEADAARESGAIGALLRREGLYSSHLTHWRHERDRGLDPRRRGPKSKRDPLFEVVRKLKVENGHLTQRLARAELIIDVQKKVSSLLGIPLATVDGDENNS
jgi:transposase